MAADALSKADFKLFRTIMPDHNLTMCWVPRTILKWLQDPVVDMDLGYKILLELKGMGQEVLL